MRRKAVGSERLVAIDTRKPDREHWREIIPQAEETLSSVGFVGNLFVAHYLKDAKTQIKMYAADGDFVREVEFPGIGTASGFGGKRTAYFDEILFIPVGDVAVPMKAVNGDQSAAVFAFGWPEVINLSLGGVSLAPGQVRLARGMDETYLPLQGLDYWARVVWHQQRDDFQQE